MVLTRWTLTKLSVVSVFPVTASVPSALVCVEV